jgi:allophanate hydrolase
VVSSRSRSAPCGLVYNSRIFDCIPVFTKSSEDAYEVLEHIAGFDIEDSLSRPDADDIDLKPRATSHLTLAIPRADQLKFFGDEEARRAYEDNIAMLEQLGHCLKQIDFTLFEQAGRLVFQSAMVAERLIDYVDAIANQSRSDSSGGLGCYRAWAQLFGDRCV